MCATSYDLYPNENDYSMYWYLRYWENIVVAISGYTIQSEWVWWKETSALALVCFISTYSECCLYNQNKLTRWWFTTWPLDHFHAYSSSSSSSSSSSNWTVDPEQTLGMFYFYPLIHFPNCKKTNPYPKETTIRCKLNKSASLRMNVDETMAGVTSSNSFEHWERSLTFIRFVVAKHD